MSIALPPGRFSGLLLKVNAFLLIALISFIARQEGRKTVYGKPLPSAVAEA